MSEQPRRLNIQVNLDTSQVPRQAEQSAKMVRTELEKQKQVVNRIMTELVTSGGKLRVPIEDFRAAANAAGNALDKMGEANAQALDRLYPKYQRLEEQMKKAYESGDKLGAIGLQNGPMRAIGIEINSRKRLGKEISATWSSLDALNSKVEQSVVACEKEEQTTQTLAQKLAETRKRMQELAASGQQNSKEYQELSTKAKEYTKALQQVNSDSKPDAQVRLRTALMNAKQAMAEAKEKFGEGSVQFQQARDKAIQLQQAMTAMNKQVKNLAAPNATFQGVINGLNGISGAASAATGTMALFGGESQQTAQVMAKLQAIMSITMGLQSMSMMLNKNSAAQLNIIGRLTAWWASCKAKAAAATTAETAAIVANTNVQAAQAATVEAGTTANVAHAASWKAVGVAIKSVPVFGWIVAMITAAIAAITLWIKYLDKARKNYKAMSEAIKSTSGEYIKERNALENLYKTATNANKSLQDRLIAIQRLKDQYPAYFKHLKNEAILAGNAADEYQRLTENIKKKALAQGIENVVEKEGEKIAEWEADHIDTKEWLDNNKSEYDRLKEKYKGKEITYTDRTVTSAKDGSTYVSTKKLTPEQIEMNWVIQYERNQKIYTDAFEKATKESRKKIDYLTKRKQEIESEILDKTEDEMRAATEGDPLHYKKLMEDAQYNADNHLLTKEQRKKAQSDYRIYRSLYEQSRFDPKDRTTALGDADVASQKIGDTEIKSERERVKKMLELTQQLEQARINIMADGAAKRERQRLFDNQREQDALYNQMQSEIDAEVARQKALWDAREAAKAKAAAAKGKQYRKQAFNSGDILTHDFNPGDTTKGVDSGNVDSLHINSILAKYGALQSVAIDAQDKRLEKEQEAEQLAMQEYLKEYGSYEEKKTAIAAIYAAKRAKAKTDAERMTIAQEEQAALDGLDFDDFITNRAALAFGEVQNLTQATIGSLIIELEKHRDKVTQTFDPEKIEKYNKALADLKRAQAMGEGNLFSQLFTSDFLKERRAAQAEIDDAEKAHNALLDAKAKKEEEVKKKIEGIIAKVKELTGETLTEDKVKDGSTVENIIGQLNKDSEDGKDKTGLSDMLDNLGKTRVELGNVTAAGNTAGTALGNLKEAFAAKFTGQGGALAMVDTIVHGINDIVQGANETVKELASTAGALGADTSVGSGWDKAQTFMQGFADASAGATEAFDSLKSGNIMGVISGVTKSFTSWIKAFASIHDASRERTIQRLQDEIDELERLNRRIEHRLESQYSKQATKSYGEEIRNLEKQRELIQQQIDAENSKKDSDGDRIKEWEDQYEELEWKIEEYKDKALDAILGEDISASIDNFADKLADSWGRVGDRARATKDFVKAMLKQMVLEAMKTDLTEPIRKLREMMAKALDDDVVTEAEQKELEAFVEQVVQENEQKYKWADKIMTDSGSGQNGATSGSFATASQESVAELSGRAAAIHTSGEMRRELLLTISQELQELRSRADDGKENETEIRNLVFLAVSHLEDISRNTHELYEMNERLGKIERNTRGLC